jgi:hypothetical protein
MYRRRLGGAKGGKIEPGKLGGREMVRHIMVAAGTETEADVASTGRRRQGEMNVIGAKVAMGFGLGQARTGDGKGRCGTGSEENERTVHGISPWLQLASRSRSPRPGRSSLDNVRKLSSSVG